MSIIDWPLDKWLDNVALAALSSKETLLATFDLARNVIDRGVPGDFIECGVFGGAQCAVMARAIMESEEHSARPTRVLTPGGWITVNGRRVHLFDSFEGLPAPGPEDREFLAAGHQAGLSVCSLDGCKDHMREWGIPDDLLVWHPGWFGETLAQWPAGNPIALLRLDADLYDSTRVCMERLYPWLSLGGWLIVDDFSLSGCRKAVDEFRAEGPGYFLR